MKKVLKFKTEEEFKAAKKQLDEQGYKEENTYIYSPEDKCHLCKTEEILSKLPSCLKLKYNDISHYFTLMIIKHDEKAYEVNYYTSNGNTINIPITMTKYFDKNIGYKNFMFIKPTVYEAAKNLYEVLTLQKIFVNNEYKSGYVI